MSVGSVESKSPSGFETGALPQAQFFFHIPKTGGSTINLYFERTFTEERLIRPKKSKIFLVDLAYGRKFNVPPELHRGCEDQPCFAGHFASLSLIKGRELEYHKVCFWRHPADWFLSYYNWQRDREKDRLRRSYSFQDFVKSLSHNPMTQDLLLYCGDVPGWRYFFMSDREKFATAIALAECFDMFADISRVDEYLQSLVSAEDLVVQSQNTVSDKVFEALDTRTRRELERLNPVDLYIHRFTMAKDKAKLLAEADAALSDGVQMRDLRRLFERLYYRLKVKVIPFI